MGGIVAPWSAAKATRIGTGAFARIATVSVIRSSVVRPPRIRITRVRPARSASLPTKAAVKAIATDSPASTAPISP